MKYKLIKFLLLISFFVGCNSCSKNNDAVHTENASLVTKLSEAYLQALNDNKEKRFDEARTTLEKALNQLPNSIVTDDSLVKYTYLALSEYKGQAIGNLSMQCNISLNSKHLLSIKTVNTIFLLFAHTSTKWQVVPTSIVAKKFKKLSNNWRMP